MTIEQVQILIVEDNPDTLEMLQRKVTALGHAVFCAVDVPAALARVEKQRIDIILTDYKMPKLSGLDLIKHISALPQIRLIMITGYPTIEGAVEEVKREHKSYITKPLRMKSFTLPSMRPSTASSSKEPINPAIQRNGKYGLLGY